LKISFSFYYYFPGLKFFESVIIEHKKLLNLNICFYNINKYVKFLEDLQAKIFIIYGMALQMRKYIFSSWKVFNKKPSILIKIMRV
jgi:hypothetical protein